MATRPLAQRCHLSMVWLTWVGLPLLAVLAAVRLAATTGRIWVGVISGIFLLAVGAAGQALYVRWFPRLSTAMGYGSVADVPEDKAPVKAALPAVTLYTASVCPFCPIVRRRLDDLQRRYGFEVREVDVTFRPQIVRAKGLRSVPVLEAGGLLLSGNATSAQIVEFLERAAKGRS
jgi:glutaredoxin